jgi:segregation and condensation protein A
VAERHDPAEKPQGQGGAQQGAPLLSVEGFEGPLDFLVEMVRRQRVDLGQLSILALIDQFVAVLQESAGRVPLEQRSTWVVLASQLVLLKSQLLAPASPAEAAAAEHQARRQLQQLEELATMRAAGAWLAARPQLGRDIHARGYREAQRRPKAEQLLAFLEAVLVMLEGRPGQDVEEQRPYRPAPPDLFRVPEALARIRDLLATRPEGGPLESFLPTIAASHPQARLKRRSALSSTLLAGLEMTRDGTAILEQQVPFGTAILRRA